MSKKLNDSMVQVRLDRRYIATASIYMQSQGIEPMSLAHMFRTMFEAMIDGLVENGQVRFMESTLDAMQYVDGQFKTDLNPRGRGLKNLSINLQKESEARDPYVHTVNIENVEKENIHKLVSRGIKDAERKLAKKQEEMEEGLEFIPEKGEKDVG